MRKLLLALLLCGCSDPFNPMPGSGIPVNQLPRVNVQAINNVTSYISPSQWAAEAEAANRAAQNEFGQDWEVNGAFVITDPADYDPGKPALISCTTFPDASKGPNVSGYHTLNGPGGLTGVPIAYIKAASGYAWRRSFSHEGEEMMVNQDPNSLLNKFKTLLGIDTDEVCDAVEANGYDVDSTGKVIPTTSYYQDSSCSDYCTPAWFGIGSVSYSLDGRPRYDFLQITTAPGQIAPYGSAP